MSEADVAPINELISEVKSQKEKIAELGTIISSQVLNPKNRSMGPQPTSPTSHAGTDLWELAEMEEEERSLAMQGPGLPVQNINIHGLGPSISPPSTSVTPMTPPRNPTAVGKVSKIAGSPICGAPSGHAASAAAGVNDQNALALTNSALEQWGAKMITWGKKHTGKTFRQIYEGDPGYVRWCQARSGSLHEDIADFLNYAITRQRLQTMANQVSNM